MASIDMLAPVALAITLAPVLTLCARRADQAFSQTPSASPHFSGAIFAAVLVAACVGGISGDTVADRLSLAALGGLLCLAAIVDLRHLILPDLALAPILILAVVRALADLGPDPIDCLAGALIGGGGLFLIRSLYRRLRGVEGLGLGDVKLVGVAGAWIGWERLPDLLLIASLGTLCCVVGVSLIGRRSSTIDPWPFGPGLALAFYAIACGLPPLVEAVGL
jgi:leader peptidase (prepilin peptidase)/N-methyltransferase